VGVSIRLDWQGVRGWSYGDATADCTQQTSVARRHRSPPQRTRKRATTSHLSKCCGGEPVANRNQVVCVPHVFGILCNQLQLPRAVLLQLLVNDLHLRESSCSPLLGELVVVTFPNKPQAGREGRKGVRWGTDTCCAAEEDPIQLWRGGQTSSSTSNRSCRYWWFNSVKSKKWWCNAEAPTLMLLLSSNGSGLSATPTSLTHTLIVPNTLIEGRGLIHRQRWGVEGRVTH
jgi:hypothetical protein